MASDFDHQLARMEKRSNNKLNPLTINGDRDDLNHCFERLNMKAIEESDLHIFFPEMSCAC
jgi:hypothetical protein